MDISRLTGAYTRTETWSELSQAASSSGSVARRETQVKRDAEASLSLRPVPSGKVNAKLEVAARLAGQTADLLYSVREGFRGKPSRSGDLNSGARLVDSALATLNDLIENSRANGQPVVEPDDGPRLAYASAENFGPILRRLSETMLGPGGVVSTMNALKSPDPVEQNEALEQVARLEARLHALADPLRRAATTGASPALDLTA
ncbi:MAG: hypothetical protein KF812_12735 [Fimbriimonadaceae bacterium]|nr:hypothetical protein [Fimbriimonadaceae bacterium]